ncbi:hypothetical protein [Streptomyces smyrnaeus]|uniref:hypothetical protein n=1 Tax=Streptomyces smyrnaeus TaxID=1387713 RepID=UPI0036C744A7
MAQPSLSRAIAHLERRMGRATAGRTSRSVNLTGAGQVFPGREPQGAGRGDGVGPARATGGTDRSEAHAGEEAQRGCGAAGVDRAALPAQSC